MRDLSWYQYALIALCVIVIFIPPKYDPAIKLREWLDRG